MSSFLESYKILMDNSSRKYLEMVIEDLLGYVEKHEGKTFVLSLLGDYIEEFQSW